MSASIFAAADLFADPNLGTDAIYRLGGAGPGGPVRAIVRRPDRIGTFNETRIAAATTMFDIRVSEVVALPKATPSRRTGSFTSSRASRSEMPNGWSGRSRRGRNEVASDYSGGIKHAVEGRASHRRTRSHRRHS